MRVPTNKMFQFMNVEQGMISASAISLKSFFCIGLDFELTDRNGRKPVDCIPIELEHERHRIEKFISKVILVNRFDK